ncbi:MAG: FRG domain-containing protein [Coprobacillus sp.]|nr:FRG domain-containing protein [Coprobacillus sp.]MDY4146135.1 FRG domain-containing protein [Bacilli bacterium]
METKSTNYCIFYRGESQKYESPCKPSLFRYIGDTENKLMIEKEYYDLSIEYLKKSQFNIKKTENNDEILSYIKYIGLMQHYGFGTRLLDVSSNSKVAKYFACCSDFSEDGFIYIFDKNQKLKQLKSIDRESIRRKFECIKNIYKITDMITNKKGIHLDTITSNVILTYETLFDTTIDNIRYERQKGSFVVTGNPLNENKEFIDSYNTIDYNDFLTIKSHDKIMNLFELSNESINYVNLFPDDDKSIKLVSLFKYLIANSINEKERYNLFIKKYKEYFILKNEDLKNEDFMSMTSRLYEDIIKENMFYFFFIEFKKFITDKYKNSSKINSFIKKNENKCLRELVKAL